LLAEDHPFDLKWPIETDEQMEWLEVKILVLIRMIQFLRVGRPTYHKRTDINWHYGTIASHLRDLAKSENFLRSHQDRSLARKVFQENARLLREVQQENARLLREVQQENDRLALYFRFDDDETNELPP